MQNAQMGSMNRRFMLPILANIRRSCPEMRTTMAKSISQIRAELQAAPETMLPDFISTYSQDERAGVQTLCSQAAKRLQKLEEEKKRVHSMRLFEQQAAAPYQILLEQDGLICGIDEAGRGPLAGPVAAGACILPPDHDMLYINDSKKLSEQKREELYEQITKEAVAWSVGIAEPSRIDEINILQATYEAMRQAISQLSPAPAVLINDAVQIPGISIPQVPVVKGDAKCLSVAAASILAKVTRDRLMREYDSLYPVYGFAANKGYGSKEHIAALEKYGPCPIHRRTFITHFALPGETPADLQEPEQSRRSLGTEMETAAAAYLQEQDVRILEKNFRSRHGEIDLIGEEKGVLCFVEVKYRSSCQLGAPEEAVHLQKQETICRTADYYRLVHHLEQTRPLRFDVVAMERKQSGEIEIRWIKNAFPYRGKSQW